MNHWTSFLILLLSLLPCYIGLSQQIEIQKPSVIYVPANDSNYGIFRDCSDRNMSTCFPPWTIDSIAIHTTEEPLERTIEIFQDPSSRVSAHYVIATNGTIYQMVNDTNRAYTTTYVNSRSIGIELVGYARDPHSFTYALMNSLTNLCAWLIQTYNIPLRHPNTTAFDYPNKGEYGWLNETGLYGHFQVQTCGSSPTLPVDQGGGGFNCKTDPGPYFPWEKLIFELSQIVGQEIQSVPTHQLRYDCGYTLKPGDSLTQLARKYKMSYWEELCIQNANIWNMTECLITRNITNFIGKQIRLAPLVSAYFDSCDEYVDEGVVEEPKSNDLYFWLFLVVVILLILVLIAGMIYFKRAADYTPIK